jgi:uncharacterized protein YjbJ (UPF0337 family)
MKIGTIDTNKARGLGDKVVGLSKEIVGTVIGNDRLARAGEEQQAKATETLKALRKHVEAARKEHEADTHEARQRTAQHAKA